MCVSASAKPSTMSPLSVSFARAACTSTPAAFFASQPHETAATTPKKAPNRPPYDSQMRSGQNRPPLQYWKLAKQQG